jgi:hypothetical protein
MDRTLVFVAALVSFFTTAAHVFGGGPEFFDVAISSTLPPEGKAVYVVIWHFVTAYLALSSTALLWSLTRVTGERPFVVLISALNFAFGTLFFAVGFSRLGSPFILLQWTLFFSIAALLILALRRSGGQQRVGVEAVHSEHLALLPGADFSDAYGACVIGSGNALKHAKAILSVQPGWVAVLMTVRNTIVAPFGLISSTKTLPHGRSHVGFFPVLSAEDRCAVLGLDDRHLDFRLLVNIEGPQDAQRVVLTTLVRTHNWLGRTYMFFVKPFHRAIVITMLNRAAATHIVN